MNTAQARALFPALLSGTLDESERTELLSFVERAPVLRREVDRLAQLFDRAGDDAVPPPPSVWSAIEAEIQRDPGPFAANSRETTAPRGSFRSRRGVLASDLSDMLFGKIAMNWRLITRDLLNRALHFQRTQDPRQSLGEILLAKGILSRAQVNEIQAYQQRINRIKSSSAGTAAESSEQTPDPERVRFGSTEPQTVAIATGDPQPGRDPDPDTDPLIGREIAGCAVNAMIGSGGMGRVYLAHHGALRKEVVLKLLSPEAMVNPRTVERFFREARSAARLEHPNVVGVQDVGTTEDGLHYIIMQYVDGCTVEEMLATDGATDLSKALGLVTQAAQALSAAHAVGIVHRDVKAENLLITRSGTLKLADFGLAKDLNAELKLTADGAMIGTPLYMAPEIGRVKTIDGRVDVYSLGVVFYYLVTGVQPFRGFSALEILSAKAHDKLAAPETKRPDLPEDYRRVLGKMLTKDRALRYADMNAVVEDLERLRAGLPIDVAPGQSPWPSEPAAAASPTARSPRVSPVLWVGLGAAALVVLGLVWILVTLLGS